MNYRHNFDKNTFALIIEINGNNVVYDRLSPDGVRRLEHSQAAFLIFYTEESKWELKQIDMIKLAKELRAIGER